MNIKGYWTRNKYMGYVDGQYKEFVSDTEYKECVKDEDKEENEDERDDN